MGRGIIKINVIITVLILLLLASEIHAQVKIDSKVFGYVGYETNPYRSPDTLYDYKIHIGYSETDMLKPDMYAEYGYKIGLTKTWRAKFSLELSSDWQNKNYFHETILNTGHFNAGLAPSLKLSKALTIGIKYEFEKRAEVDVDVLGDQTRYVFSYIQHAGTIFVKTKPWKKNIANIYYTFDQKQYSPAYTNYSGVGNIPDEIYLDNIQHTLDLRLIQGLSQRSSLAVKIIAYDREYKYLPSIDSLLSPNNSSMRHYQDFNAKLTYDNKINNFIEVKPYVRFERRNDLFNDYYSFNLYEGGMLIDLSYRKFSLELNGWYELYKYDKLEAPTNSIPYPVLKYQYYNANPVLKYKILKSFDIDFSASYVLRVSNANRVTWGYRRGYENSLYRIGLIFYPFWKTRIN